MNDYRIMFRNHLIAKDAITPNSGEKMNKILVIIALVTSLMGCAAALDMQTGVEMRPGEATAEKLFNYGIGQPWIGGNPPWEQEQYMAQSNGYSNPVATSQYSQYYTISPVAVPKIHITAPEEYEIQYKTPAYLYINGHNQAIPYSQYQTYNSYIGGNSLWIEGGTSWTQYVAVPQGASLSLIASSPTGGNGFLYEISPDGRLISNDCYFYQHNRIGFYADSIGQHILLFIIDGQVSNPIIIDVVSYSPFNYQPQSYVPPSYYYPDDSFPYFYPKHWYPKANVSPRGFEDHKIGNRQETK